MMAQISFEGPAVMVRNMKASRSFYEGLLGQEVRFEVGDDYVHYTSGFSLWLVSSAMQTIHGETEETSPGSRNENRQDTFELYFETAALDEVWKHLSAEDVEPAHEMRTQPWGQRCFRVRDPDGYLVEVGEPMSVVAERFLSQGFSIEETARKTFLPEAMLREMCNVSS